MKRRETTLLLKIYKLALCGAGLDGSSENVDPAAPLSPSPLHPSRPSEGLPTGDSTRAGGHLSSHQNIVHRRPLASHKFLNRSSGERDFWLPKRDGSWGGWVRRWMGQQSGTSAALNSDRAGEDKWWVEERWGGNLRAKG